MHHILCRASPHCHRQRPEKLLWRELILNKNLFYWIWARWCPIITEVPTPTEPILYNFIHSSRKYFLNGFSVWQRALRSCCTIRSRSPSTSTCNLYSWHCSRDPATLDRDKCSLFYGFYFFCEWVIHKWADLIDLLTHRCTVQRTSKHCVRIFDDAFGKM